MGKNGKLRKKRRLENALSGPSSDLALDSSEEENEKEETTKLIRKTPTIKGYLSNDYIENAVKCLDYYGQHFEEYQTPENKVLRKCLFPLIDEQKSKNFNPAMNTTTMNTSHTASASVDSEDAEHDLPTAILTFRSLAEKMDIFRSKDLKQLRRALYPLVVATRSVHGLKEHTINISGEISDALNLRQWDVVFHKLIEMKKTGTVPKLGALQRWVRQCGDIQPKELAIFLLSRIIDLTANSNTNNCSSTNNNNNNNNDMPLLSEEEIQCLTATYHLFASAATPSTAPSSSSSSAPSTPLIEYLPPFLAKHIRDHPPPYNSKTTILTNTAAMNITKNRDAYFEVDSCVKGKDRRPPCNTDMNIYRNKPNILVYDRDETAADHLRQPSCVCHINNDNRTGGSICIDDSDHISSSDIANTVDDATATTTTTTTTTNVSTTAEVRGGGGGRSFGGRCPICRGVYRDAVTGVQGALLLSNVLSPGECAQFMAYAEMLGYYEDAVEGIEALVWMAEKTLLQPIFDRCKNALPQFVVTNTNTNTNTNAAHGSSSGGKHVKKVTGINPRLRFFRYQKGAVYRPHIDGSWTANKAKASLVADTTSSTSNNNSNNSISNNSISNNSISNNNNNNNGSQKQEEEELIHSYYTFLIYLNDDFEGGGTTFFVPPTTTSSSSFSSSSSVASESNTTDNIEDPTNTNGSTTNNNSTNGGNDYSRSNSSNISSGNNSSNKDQKSAAVAAIVARTVQPIQGSVLLFPHGVVEGSLVHEGSAVVGHGTKYVIRTDLMFS